jgi:negative regulator of flagellin synthesis FlgM
MDVNNLNSNSPLDRRPRDADLQQTRDGAGRAGEGSQADEARQSRSADEVRLSAQALQLRDIESQVAELDAFDQTRVDEIKAAISEGRYHVDPERLAERFLDLEKELNQ